MAAMISNRMTVSKNIFERIAAAKLQVVPAKLKLREVPTWRSQPSVFNGSLFNGDNCISVSQNVQLSEANQVRPDTFKLIAPSSKTESGVSSLQVTSQNLAMAL